MKKNKTLLLLALTALTALAQTNAANDNHTAASVPVTSSSIEATLSNRVPHLAFASVADGPANTNLPLQVTDRFSGLWQPTIGSIGYVINGKEQWRTDPVGYKSFGPEKTPGRFYEVTNFNAGFGMDASINLSKDKAFQFTDRWMILSDRKLAVGGVMTDGGTGHGQVLIFSNANPTASNPRWVETQKLQPPFGGTALRYGYSSSFDNTNLFVSEIMTPTGVGTMGKVFTYWLSNNATWQYGQQLFIPDTVATISPGGQEEYGHTLRVSGTNAALGVLWGNTISGIHTNYRSGYVGTYWLSNGVWQLGQWLFNVGTRTNSNFGGALDIDETGTNLFVQARDDAANGRGKLVWFQLRSGVWTNVNTISVGDTADTFGLHVSAYQGRMIVGAPHSEFSTATGSVHFVTYEGTNWTWRGSHKPTDVDPGSEIQIRYGWIGGLEQRGDIAVVGMPWVDSAGRKSSIINGTNGMGKVHVFRWSGNTASLADVLAPPDRQFGDLFGVQAYTDGTNIYAVSGGCYRSSPTPTNFMRIYAFTNVPPMIPANRDINLYHLSAEDAWTMSGSSGEAVQISRTTSPALAHEGVPAGRWTNTMSGRPTFIHFAPAADNTRTVNWSVPSWGYTNWTIEVSLLSLRGFTNNVTVSLGTVRKDGTSESFEVQSGGFPFRYPDSAIHTFVTANIPLVRVFTNGTLGPSVTHFTAPPGDEVNIKFHFTDATATNIWLLLPVKVLSW